MKFSPRQWDVIQYIEIEYFSEGSIPTVQRLMQLTGEDEKYIQRTLRHPSAVEYLSERNIDLSNENGSRTLYPIQLAAVNYILASGPGDLRKKLDDLRKQYNNDEFNIHTWDQWMTDPAFVEYLSRRTERVFDNSDWKMRQAILKNIDAGDLPSIKFYAELRGIWNPRVDVNVNVPQLLSKFMDVVSRYVDDDTMLNIADDLQAVARGDEPQSALSAMQTAQTGLAAIEAEIVE